MPAPREACQEPVVNTYFIGESVGLSRSGPPATEASFTCIEGHCLHCLSGRYTQRRSLDHGDATGDVGAVLDWRLTALKTGV